MMLLVVLLLVLILGVCLSPKKVKTTPVSTPEIELYRREHASGIVVTDAVITFPESYGKDIYTDGSDEDVELSAMRITLRYGTQAVFPFNSSQSLSSGGGLTFTRVDGGLDPEIWYRPSEQGKKIMLTFEDSRYTQGQDVILEVGFKNEGMDTYEIAQKNFGPGSRYTVVNDKRPVDSFVGSQSYQNDKVAQCEDYCDDLDGCAQFWITGGGTGTCYFYGADATYSTAAGVTTYKKVAGGGSPS